MIDWRSGSGHRRGCSTGPWKGGILRGIDVSLELMKLASLDSFQPIRELEAEESCARERIFPV